MKKKAHVCMGAGTHTRSWVSICDREETEREMEILLFGVCGLVLLVPRLLHSAHSGTHEFINEPSPLNLSYFYTRFVFCSFVPFSQAPFISILGNSTGHRGFSEVSPVLLHYSYMFIYRTFLTDIYGNMFIFPSH